MHSTSQQYRPQTGSLTCQVNQQYRPLAGSLTCQVNQQYSPLTGSLTCQVKQYRPLTGSLTCQVNQVFVLINKVNRLSLVLTLHVCCWRLILITCSIIYCKLLLLNNCKQKKKIITIKNILF